jgi:8-oxo-dGTP pyrophosphatase MutT (NUDIX family)
MSGASGIIFKNNQKEVLLVKRRDIPMWVLPGGRLEFGETPEQTVIREVFEETGFRVEIHRKSGEYSHKKSNKITHTFVCNIQSGEKTFSNESCEIEYFEIDNLPEMFSPYERAMLEHAVDERNEMFSLELDPLPLSFWLKSLLHPWALFKYLLTRVGIHWNS